MKGAALLFCLTAGALAGASQAQTPVDPDWMPCTRLAGDNPARLACFDQWARQQAPARPGTPVPAASPPSPAPLPAPPGEVASFTAAAADCKNYRPSELSRFWELETCSVHDTPFGIRGYRPISLSLIGSSSVNTAPGTPAPGHTAPFTPYGETETRLQLSMRTKIAQGLLTGGEPVRRDSLWFGYTQQSYWQLFNGNISRPFRTTDHEPEIIYIHPTDAPLPFGWRLRYSGLSLNHQSNGQSLPLSRSWNRVILMAGMEKDDRFRLSGRLWQRMPEEAANDDNPDISDFVGRAELSGAWQVNPDHTLAVTVRHSLRATANGSIRFEWLKTLGRDVKTGGGSGLRFHTQLFSGYGDSLVDYNRRRTVLSVGLSLVDW